MPGRLRRASAQASSLPDRAASGAGLMVPHVADHGGPNATAAGPAGDRLPLPPGGCPGTSGRSEGHGADRDWHPVHNQPAGLRAARRTGGPAPGSRGGVPARVRSSLLASLARLARAASLWGGQGARFRRCEMRRSPGCRDRRWASHRRGRLDPLEVDLARYFMVKAIRRIEAAGKNDRSPAPADAQDLDIFLTALCGWSGLERPVALRSISTALTEQNGQLLVAAPQGPHPVALAVSGVASPPETSLPEDAVGTTAALASASRTAAAQGQPGDDWRADAR